VKALVLGESYGNQPATMRVRIEVFEQRDAVYVALADMAQHEDGAAEAQNRAAAAFNMKTFPPNYHRSDASLRPSAGMLERYVEHLIEQVGALEGT
jgi:hypothetical protein